MSFTITNTGGTGSLSEETLFTYEYSEDATSIDPSQLDGGVGQFSFTGIEVSDTIKNGKLADSKYLINNDIVATDSDRGSIGLKVKKVTTNAGVATVIGETVQSKLNVERTFPPYYKRNVTHLWNGTAHASRSVEIDDKGVTRRLNECYNPSFEVDASGWTTFGSATMATSTAQAKFGSRSLLVTFPTALSASSGVYFQTTTLPASTNYTASVWVYTPSSATTSPAIYAATLTGTPIAYSTQTTGMPNDQWNRLIVNFTTTTSGAYRFYIVNANDSVTGDTTYLDGVLIEQTPQQYGYWNNDDVSTGGYIAGTADYLQTTQPYFDGASGTTVDPLYDGTVEGAFNFYCAPYGVIPLTSWFRNSYAEVAFVGWNGNVWDYLKMLCHSIPFTPFTMVCDSDVLVVKNSATATSSIDIKSNATTYSVDIDSGVPASKVEIYNYNTEFKTNTIVYDANNYSSSYAESKKFLSSFSDSFQVDSGETIIKTFKINASLVSVNQPTCVSTISSVPYTGTTGEYVIVGNDGLPILPAQWLGEGGSLTVSLGDNPDEITITVVAPPVDKILSSDGGTYTVAPYRIGVETSGDNVDYPALWITGTGVFYEKTLSTFVTGADEINSVTLTTVSIDNPFITNEDSLVYNGVTAAQNNCGPFITMNIDTIPTIDFGEASKKIYGDRNNFYLSSVGYSHDATVATAKAFATFSDFRYLQSGNGWNTKTFAQFTSTVNQTAGNMTFADFTIMPLIDPA